MLWGREGGGWNSLGRYGGLRLEDQSWVVCACIYIYIYIYMYVFCPYPILYRKIRNQYHCLLLSYRGVFHPHEWTCYHIWILTFKRPDLHGCRQFSRGSELHIAIQPGYLGALLLTRTTLVCTPDRTCRAFRMLSSLYDHFHLAFLMCCPCNPDPHPKLSIYTRSDMLADFDLSTSSQT